MNVTVEQTDTTTAVYFKLKDGKSQRTLQIGTVANVDYDAAGSVLGVELLLPIIIRDKIRFNIPKEE